MFQQICKVKKHKNRFSVNLQNLLYTIFCKSTVIYLFAPWYLASTCPPPLSSPSPSAVPRVPPSPPPLSPSSPAPAAPRSAPSPYRPPSSPSCPSGPRCSTLKTQSRITEMVPEQTPDVPHWKLKVESQRLNLRDGAKSDIWGSIHKAESQRRNQRAVAKSDIQRNIYKDTWFDTFLPHWIYRYRTRAKSDIWGKSISLCCALLW